MLATALVAALPALAKAALPTLVPALIDIAGRHQRNEITREQLDAEVSQTVVATLGDVAQADAEAIAATFSAFIGAAATNPLLARVWAAVVLTELAVLVWHQVGIPALVAFTPMTSYPSSGATVEWAYLLIAFCLGAGPAVLRAGPAAGGFMSALGKLTGRGR